jgi:hypothetical protein
MTARQCSIDATPLLGATKESESDARLDVFLLKSGSFSTYESGPRNTSSHTPVCLNPPTTFDLVRLLKHWTGVHKSCKQCYSVQSSTRYSCIGHQGRGRNAILNGSIHCSQGLGLYDWCVQLESKRNCCSLSKGKVSYTGCSLNSHPILGRQISAS